MSEETKKTPNTISRREFLKDAGIVVGGTAVGSAFFLSACGKEVEVTKTVTTTAPGKNITITKYVCPVCGQEYESLTSLTAHIESTHPNEGDIITKYVCAHCGEEFSSLSALQTHSEEAHPAGQEKIINFTVNGQKYNMQIEPNWTLQELLHDKLGWTSIKDMCYGFGACGSCSVIMDGRPVLSCMILATECDGAVIETAEGAARSNPALIEAYVYNFAPACGYCTPGFVVTAKALLDKNPNPTKAEIKDALGGNICRCSTYRNHVKAVLVAAGQK